MKKQKGVSLSGLLLICAGLIAVALLGFKLFPAYAEYYKVKSAIDAITRGPEKPASPKEIQAAFGRRSTIDNITAVRGEDLEISKQSDGYAVTAAWSVKVPLVANVSACMDFEVRSK